MKNVQKFLIGKPEYKRGNITAGRTWKDTIKMDLKNIVYLYWLD
jgi:hypothetical protein